MSDLIILKRPPKPDRETARTRQGMSVRVDASLVKAFHDTCKRHGYRPSDLMEAILWNALGEPRMSFEVDSREQGQEVPSHEPRE